jgi:hypothetical protein
MIASVTRLRVRSVRFLPLFLWHTLRSQRQVVRASGFLGGRLLVDSWSTYWTLTTWIDEQAMRNFRGVGAHSKVMPRLAHWCDEASYTHWTPSEDSVPEWNDAYAQLLASPRLSRVSHPSQDHSAQNFAKPRLNPMIGQTLKPVTSTKS